MQLTPAREYKRLAGRWIVWRAWERDASPKGKFRRYLYVGQVRRKQGDTLITHLWYRVDVRDAWVLSEEPTAWPQTSQSPYGARLLEPEGWRVLGVTPSDTPR